MPLRTRGIEVEDIKGIFITHMHGDHTKRAHLIRRPYQLVF